MHSVQIASTNDKIMLLLFTIGHAVTTLPSSPLSLTNEKRNLKQDSCLKYSFEIIIFATILGKFSPILRLVIVTN